MPGEGRVHSNSGATHPSATFQVGSRQTQSIVLVWGVTILARYCLGHFSGGAQTDRLGANYGEYYYGVVSADAT